MYHALIKKYELYTRQKTINQLLNIIIEAHIYYKVSSHMRKKSIASKVPQEH